MLQRPKTRDIQGFPRERSAANMKLGLGTAQFGYDYGISNSIGQTPIFQARAILNTAAAHGVQVIDTATAYGTSESVLGELLSDWNHTFKIVTKIPKFEQVPNDIAGWVADTVKSSLRRLRQSKVYAALLHSADLPQPMLDELSGSLQSLKREGLFNKVGVSVYSSDQIDALFERYQFDLIQVPFNIFDQRLLLSGHLQQLKRSGIEIHARSAFLQGLLLMDLDDIPSYFAPYMNHIRAYHKAVRTLDLSLVDVALSFVLNQPEIDTVVCGVNDAMQFDELVVVASVPLKQEKLLPLLPFASGDLGLIDPSIWRI